jgi:dCTP deaminase
MSVVPFLFEGPLRTVVDTSSDFDAAGGLEGTVTLIKELDRSQFVREARNSNVSYDLRVGGEYRDHKELGKRDLPEGGAIKLLPGMAVIVETLEEVHLPRSAFGVIVPKVSLSQEGVTNTASKVDPGYHGRLLVTAFNLGKKTVLLRRAEPFCSMYILRVGDGSRAYERAGKKLLGEARDRHWDKVRYALEANTGVWLVVLSIATAILLILQAISLARTF